jgi:hypothetical protein
VLKRLLADGALGADIGPLAPPPVAVGRGRHDVVVYAADSASDGVGSLCRADGWVDAMRRGRGRACYSRR